MNRTILSMFALTALVACNGGKDDTGPGGDDTGNGGDDGGGCDTEAIPKVPASDAVDAYYRAAIEVELADGQGDETIAVSAGGAEIAGTVTNDNTNLVFTPSAPLAPSTEHSVTVTTCAGESTYTFTTSPLGTPTDGCDLTGQTFIVDLQGARFVEPAGVAELLLGQLEDSILLSPTEVSDSSVSMIGALGSATGAQDECTASLNDFPAASYDDPYFALAADNLTLAVSGLEITIDSFAISGDFKSDCSGFGGGTLAGELDARTLAPLLGDLLGITDPDEVCATLTGFGVTCEACASDGAEYCVEVYVDQLNASATDGALQVITQEDVDANADCQ